MLEAALHLLFVRTFYKFIHLKKLHVFVLLTFSMSLFLFLVNSVSMKCASIACYRNEIIIGQYDICTLFS